MKFLLTLIIGLLLPAAGLAAPKPLKVYILSGQSNMQGHADVTTFDYIGKDKATAPLLESMRDAEGNPVVCDNVWITSIGSGEGEKHGKLTAGYGARDTKIGPEFTFGIYMQKHVREPILIIKTAWGGKSINTDFRSPSAGPYVFNEKQIEQMKSKGTNLEEAKAKKAEATGHYYRLMMEHVQTVLKDIKRVYPDYDAKAGYELAGFVWFQGWNDMVDGSTYPTRGAPGGYDSYSENLAHFIRDVRKDLKVSDLPFVIGVMGAGGPTGMYKNPRYVSIHQSFRDAMAAPASMPEFKGNVTTVLTEKYWDHKLEELRGRNGKAKAFSKELDKDNSLTREQRREKLNTFKAELYSDEDHAMLKGASNAEFHYMGAGKILGQIGKAFADALNGL